MDDSAWDLLCWVVEADDALVRQVRSQQMTLNGNAISRTSRCRRHGHDRGVTVRQQGLPVRGPVNSGLVSPWVLWLGSVVLFIEIWSR